MAAELPIVATNVGGIPSIIENETNGFLVEPQDAAQIADKVSLILNSPQMKFNLSKNNREKVQKYSWDSSITALEKVYSDCLRAT
jgi:glycosyltransferase involved in cell wall biosynthesis